MEIRVIRPFSLLDKQPQIEKKITKWHVRLSGMVLLNDCLGDVGAL